MTFTEAAAEVLKQVGKPLHYKKITQLAIERNLLSHVGKTPETTMSSRLATMVRKDGGDAPIIKVKPGIFGLRDFDGAPPASGAAEVDDADTEEEEVDDAESASEEEDRPAHPGADVFPTEEGDDEPILAKLERQQEERRAKQQDDKGKRRKRRRRRRGRGDDDDNEVESQDRDRAPRGRDRSRDRSDRDRSDRDRSDRDRSDRERGDRERSDRERGDRERSDRASRSERTSRSDRSDGRGRSGQRGRGGRSGRSVEGDWDRQPQDGDLLGLDLASALEAVMGGRPQRGLTLTAAASGLVKEGRLQGDASSLAPTLAAAIRGDAARRQQQGRGPRFRLRGDEVELVAWSTPKSVSDAEKRAETAADQQRREVRRALITHLAQMPASGLLELLAAWLNAEGITGLRGVRRPGSGRDEFHLAGTWNAGPRSLPVAILVRRRGDLGREQVIELRGGLHHYGNAKAAWLITLGRVLRGAKEEADLEAAPAALYDGDGLAEALERMGIGVVSHALPLLSLDLDLLESLHGPGRSSESDDSAAQNDDDDRGGSQGGKEGGEGRRRRRRRGGSRSKSAAEGASNDSAEDIDDEDESSVRGATASADTSEDDASVDDADERDDDAAEDDVDDDGEEARDESDDDSEEDDDESDDDEEDDSDDDDESDDDDDDDESDDDDDDESDDDDDEDTDDH